MGRLGAAIYAVAILSYGVGSIDASFAAERQLSVPLTLEDQVVLIPQLCDAAMFGYRAQFQGLCDGLRAQLKVAQEAAEKAKGEEKK